MLSIQTDNTINQPSEVVGGSLTSTLSQIQHIMAVADDFENMLQKVLTIESIFIEERFINIVTKG